MKKVIFTLWLITFALVDLAIARIQDKTFASGEAMTAGKLFLNQVDTVCLYLSTDRIVYEPRLQDDMTLDVTITLLEVADSRPSEPLRKFIMRHIKTFNKTMTERLEFYAPELAKEFNPQQDVRFLIQVGLARKKLASYQTGEWQWLQVASSAQPAKSKPVVPSQSAKESPPVDTCKAQCPALKKPEKTSPLL